MTGADVAQPAAHRLVDPSLLVAAVGRLMDARP
jgi:hypothetical protein